MQSQSTPSVAERDAHTDHVILGLLISDGSQRPWSVREVEREVGSGAVDSLARLYGAGLIHRLDSFAWATRAALIADAMAS
jgi:hypothetical protein